VDELNDAQRKAAEFINGVCAVIAVPGSGKTMTMTRRIGFLINEKGVSPESILGLTFTRSAAQTMKDRLLPVLEDMAGRVQLSTIHSFCLKLLKREGVVFEILTGKEQIRFVRDIIKKKRFKSLSVGLVLKEISLAKNNLIPVDEFYELYDGDQTMTQVAEVFRIYDDNKKKEMLKDFDDLLLDAYDLLANNPKVMEKYRNTFNHLLVDEFQDTTPSQLELIKLLSGDDSPDGGGNASRSLWVTGDDWQSIFAFTGASVGNIINFKSIFPTAEEIILDLNYRSTGKILKACQSLISHNVRKIEKTLRTDNGDGEDIVVLDSATEEEEAVILVHEIIDLVERRGVKHNEIAILYRCNFQSRIIEEVFSQRKLPYQIENGQKFYDRYEVKCLLDYLRVVNDPQSETGDEALANILNVPNRYVSRKFIAELEAYADNKSCHLYDALKTFRIKPPYIRHNIKDFLKFMNPLIKDCENFKPAEVISILREGLDYDNYITEDDLPSPDDLKIQNINQLQMAAVKYQEISSFLAYIETFVDESLGKDKDGVRLMTIHKAKGQEFPVVFVIGLVEGCMPTKKGNIEEERRICFVALSRAMNNLYLSWSRSYLGQPANRSIFLDEALAA